MIMTPFRWIVLTVFFLFSNTVTSVWVFKTFWAFIVLSIFEGAGALYYIHRQRIYKDGLMAISPKKLFKQYQDNFHREYDEGLDDKRSKNAKALDAELKKLDTGFAKSKKRFNKITGKIDKILARSEVKYTKLIQRKIKEYMMLLESEQKNMNIITKKMLDVNELIEQLNVVDSEKEGQNIDKMTDRLDTELFRPQLHMDRRVLSELDGLNLKIEKYRKDLDKRLTVRGGVRRR